MWKFKYHGIVRRATLGIEKIEREASHRNSSLGSLDLPGSDNLLVDDTIVSASALLAKMTMVCVASAGYHLCKYRYRWPKTVLKGIYMLPDKLPRRFYV